MENERPVADIIFEDVLVEKVRSYSYLYCVSSNKYKDVARNDSSWHIIAQEISQLGVECTAEACKTKWRYLRDNYVKKSVNIILARVGMAPRPSKSGCTSRN